MTTRENLVVVVAIVTHITNVQKCANTLFKTPPRITLGIIPASQEIVMAAQ